MTGRFRPHSWRHKFWHAYRGLNRAIRTQHSFAVHLAIGGFAVGVAALLQVTAVEWAVLAVTIGLVLRVRSLTSAIERETDPVKQNKLIAKQNKLLAYLDGLGIAVNSDDSRLMTSIRSKLR